MKEAFILALLAVVDHKLGLVDPVAYAARHFALEVNVQLHLHGLPLQPCVPLHRLDVADGQTDLWFCQCTQESSREFY